MRRQERAPASDTERRSGITAGMAARSHDKPSRISGFLSGICVMRTLLLTWDQSAEGSAGLSLREPQTRS